MTQEIIDEAVQRLVAAAQPRKIILFGSHSRGEANSRSDLDFLVIEDAVTKPRAETVRLQDALRPMRIPVDIIVASEKRIKRGKILQVRFISTQREKAKSVMRNHDVKA